MNTVPSLTAHFINSISVRKKVFVAAYIGIFFLLVLCILFIIGLVQQRALIDDIFNKRFRIYIMSK